MASTINAAVGGIVNTADASGELALQASGTTVATLTASGNVGIGTSSPGAKLEVSSATPVAIQATSSSVNGVGLYLNSTQASGSKYSILSGNVAASALSIKDETNNATRVTLDSSGNLGLGVTPSAWGGSVGTGNLQLAASALYTFGTNGGGIATNAYYGASNQWIYKASTVAALYQQTSGQHQWYNAASGTAGNAITFTQAMTLTSTGNLLVGTTTDLSGVTGAISDVNGNVRAIPQSGAAKTTSYTLVKGDVGEFINVGSGGSIVVPDAVFATGDVVSVFNNTSGNITITCSITTAYIGGTDADKATITLATRGIATILFISGTVCVVNGNVS